MYTDLINKTKEILDKHYDEVEVTELNEKEINIDLTTKTGKKNRLQFVAADLASHVFQNDEQDLIDLIENDLVK